MINGLFEEKISLKQGQQFAHALDTQQVYTVYEVANELVYLEKTNSHNLVVYALAEFLEELQAGVFFEVANVSRETPEEETDKHSFYANSYFDIKNQNFVCVTHESDTHLFLSNLTCFEKDEFVEKIGNEFLNEILVSFCDTDIVKQISLQKFDFKKDLIHTNLTDVCIYEQITPHQLFLVSAKNKKTKTKIKILEQ